MYGRMLEFSNLLLDLGSWKDDIVRNVANYYCFGKAGVGIKAGESKLLVFPKVLPGHRRRPSFFVSLLPNECSFLCNQPFSMLSQIPDCYSIVQSFLLP